MIHLRPEQPGDIAAVRRINEMPFEIKDEKGVREVGGIARMA